MSDKQKDEETAKKWIAFFKKVIDDGFSSCGMSGELYHKDNNKKFVDAASKQFKFVVVATYSGKTYHWRRKVEEQQNVNVGDTSKPD